MPRPAPSRVAAALDYLERLKSQAAEFGGGVVENLADRARNAGELVYEALTSDPNIGRMTTAEFAQAADRPTPRLDQAARDIGTIGRAIVTQPVETGKAIVQGEVERAREAMSSPRAAGQYAGSFIDPMRIAAALRKTAPVLELDVYHGTPHRFEPTEANPLGEFDASKIGAGQGAQIHGQGIYFTENPKEAAQHRKIKGLQKNNEPADEFKVADAAAYAAKEKTGASLYHAELASHNILDWVRKGNKAEDFLRHNEVPESLRPVYKAALPYYAGYSKNEGSLYKADLPDEMIARMIDAEKPINQQSAEVRKALEEAGIDTKSSMLGSQISQKDLQKSGIAGLFYTNNRPGGPRNFVVFPGEEKKVKILERNGQPAPERIAQALEAAPTVPKKVTQKSLEKQLKAVDPNASLVKTVVFDGQGNRKPMYVARVNNKSVEIGSHLDDVEAWAQESLESLANQRKAASINAELGLPETAQTGLWVVQGVDPQGNPFNMERAKKAAEKIRFRHEQTNYDDMLQQGISKEEARGDVLAMFNRLKASK